MVRIALVDKKGFTLIEILIALVVLLLVSLALTHTALVGINSNMRNVLRDEAVKIAEERMNMARNLAFTRTIVNLVSDTTPFVAPCIGNCPAVFPAIGQCSPRNLRSIPNFPFCTSRAVTVLDPPVGDTRQVNITVGWRWKNQDYTHSITTIIGRQ